MRMHFLLTCCTLMFITTLTGCQTTTAQTPPEAPPETAPKSAPTAAAQGSGEKKNQAPSAEAQGWELVFHDTFNRNELGENWTVIDGEWEIKDGQLHGNGTLISTIAFPASPPVAFQRLEFEAISNIKALNLFPGSKPNVVASDMDCFIHAHPYKKGDRKTMTSGYFFQFGGHYNTANRIRYEGKIIWEAKEDEEEETEAPISTIVQDQWQHVVVENDWGTLRFYVDGQLLHQQKIKAITMGTGQDHVGLYFLTDVKVREIKVYLKRMPNDLDVE